MPPHLCALLCGALVLLRVAGAQQSAGEIRIVKTLGDNTLEQTFVLNLLNELFVHVNYSQAELEQISFQYLTITPSTDYFTLSEKTGNLRTSQLVDRDVLCPSQPHCTIELLIGILPSSLFRTIRVMINVTDTNDNAPQFTRPTLSLHVPETSPSGLLAPLASARDLDSPANGVSEYRLIQNGVAESGLFSLHLLHLGASATELRLMLNGSLDRERQTSYSLQVQALDGGIPQRTGTLTINLQVTDVNDNQPVFDQSTYNVELPESYPINHTFVQVNATDLDEGVDAQIVYSFNPSTHRSLGDIFAIHPNTGAISLRTALDFETRSSFLLTVASTDRGLNAIPSTTKVVITVLDENDEIPVIVLNEPPSDWVLRVAENQDKNTYVAHISVQDGDSGMGGQVICFNDHTSLFNLSQIYEKEYKLVTSSELDRETVSQLSLTITCHDLGETIQHESQLELFIEITDADDNLPVFAHDKYLAYLAENNRVGAEVTQVQALDRDTGVNALVRYSLLNASQYFSIDAQSGVIRALQVFDRETRDLYELAVIAHGGETGEQSALAIVSVHITDIDDNAPHFLSTQETSVRVREDIPRGTLITTVTAVDADLPPNDNFTYTINPSSNTENRFRINAVNGSIFSRIALDRELNDIYELRVIAQSMLSPTFRDVLIIQVILEDVNDNSPIISFPTTDWSLVQLSSETPLGHKFTRIMAYDIDSGVNANLSYTMTDISGEEIAIFQIDPVSGSIFVTNDLQHLMDMNITAQVLVSDDGSPPRTSTRILSIYINGSYSFVTGGSQRAVGSNNENGSNSLPVILGCISGVVIVALVVVLVLLLLRRRKRREGENKEAVTCPAWAPSYESGGRVDDSLPDIPRGGATSVSRLQLTLDATQVGPTGGGIRDSQAEKDSDSGCFDLSHSDTQSSADGGSNQGSAIHGNPHHNAGNHSNLAHSSSLQAGNSNARNPVSRTYSSFSQPRSAPPPDVCPPGAPRPPLRMSSNYTPPPTDPNTRQLPPSTAVSMVARSASMSLPHPPPPPAIHGSASPCDDCCADLPPPPPPLLGTYPIAAPTTLSLAHPQRSGFSDYLQRESREMRQRGHMYHVSGQPGTPSPPPPQCQQYTPSYLAQNTGTATSTVQPVLVTQSKLQTPYTHPSKDYAVRKTVRFSSDAKDCSSWGDDSSRVSKEDNDWTDRTPRAVPNTYVDCDLLRSIALHTRKRESEEDTDPRVQDDWNRPSGTAMPVRGTSELDSLV